MMVPPLARHHLHHAAHLHLMLSTESRQIEYFSLFPVRVQKQVSLWNSTRCFLHRGTLIEMFSFSLQKDRCVGIQEIMKSFNRLVSAVDDCADLFVRLRSYGGEAKPLRYQVGPELCQKVHGPDKSAHKLKAFSSSAFGPTRRDPSVSIQIPTEKVREKRWADLFACWKGEGEAFPWSASILGQILPHLIAANPDFATT